MAMINPGTFAMKSMRRFLKCQILIVRYTKLEFLVPIATLVFHGGLPSTGNIW